MTKILYLSILPTLLLSSDIALKVKNIETKEGKLFIGLYKQAKNFSSTTKYFKATEKNIESKTVEHTFTNIPNGQYAIAVFQDINKNKKLDKNFWGLPIESFGFSNNPKISFTQPTFDESSFNLKRNTSLNIILQ